jgi:hypothetical protein
MPLLLVLLCGAAVVLLLVPSCVQLFKLPPLQLLL